MSPSRPEKQDAAHAAMSGKVEYTETVHHAGARKSARGTRKIPQLNLTSMLDVCFLLLIFFVLTANFVAAEGVIAANLPTGVSDADPIKPNQEPLKIVLRAVAGTDDVIIWIERQPQITDGDFYKLYKILEGLRWDPKLNPNGSIEPDNPIIIKPLKGIRWDHVVNAFNACVRAKFENVNFAEAG